jgi:transcriptional regulator with PAS, ATPase and Fis domain
VTTDNTEVVKKRGVLKGAPRHFHLLWDHDLEDLREVLEAILKHRDEVVRHWYQLYVLHFGDARCLSEAEFTRIFEPAIERNKTALLEGDMERYASEVIGLGEALARQGVPLEEVIASLHLFEESAHSVFPQDPPPPTHIYTLFDKLSHVRIILLVSAYFRLRSAIAGERIVALEREAARLPTGSRTRFRGLVGATPAMRELYDRIEAAARTRGTVLIVGESGTGKELVAHAIHVSGPQQGQPFIALNCAAIPKDLIESELFGYKRGAFSGANAEYAGLFRAADGGTLFLDEVTEMTPETQSKLLRAIQERAVRPVGATRELPVDVRLIGSTNRDPEKAVEDRQLRPDLYYRLQASVLRVAPMRERQEDIPLLVEHFIAVFNKRFGRDVAGIDPAALRAMAHYSWPGNVRELSNAIEGALTFGNCGTLRLEDIPPKIAAGTDNDQHDGGGSASGGLAVRPISTLAEAEHDLIRRALESTGGNRLRAAKLLQISRKKLYAVIEKYSL